MLRAMLQRTHGAINARLCGVPRELSEGRAVVTLTAVEEMRADERGLVHGGFVFGLADFAAMLAVGEPNVVLGSAEVRFNAPVVVGGGGWGPALPPRAEEKTPSGKKRLVSVEVLRDGTAVMTGTFTCFVPNNHVLGAREELP
jgi:acyl-coenzyme A thioesterase PaaI-like protein